jgi:hypothetical protein
VTDQKLTTRSLLPEYQAPFGTLFAKAVKAMVPAHEPLLASIRSSSVDHLADESVTEAHGGVMGGTAMSARMEVQTEAIVQTDLDAWYNVLWSAAEQFAGHQMRYLLASVEAATQRTGNSANLGGAPITHDALLDMLERVEVEVDDDGTPQSLVILHVDPSGRRTQRTVVEHLMALGPMSTQQVERYQQIIAEKRRAQDAKKRVRRLDRRPG